MNEIKPVLRQMIDNNKPHWRPETIRGAHKMLDEYETKAKAWDKLNEYVSTTPYDGIDMDTLKNRLNKFMDESGGYDAKK